MESTKIAISTESALDKTSEPRRNRSPMESSAKEFETLKNRSGLKSIACNETDVKQECEDEELHSLLLPDPASLPLVPPSSIESNFIRYYATDFIKPGHDQYVYRHANGLCVVGLAPTHVALKEGGITVVDFNVGKTNKSEIKVTGKRKKNAQRLDTNSALCKVCTKETFYIARCVVKGSLLEVNDRLINQPSLLNDSAAREGYVAILMPNPTDWLKVKESLLSHEEYQKLKGLC